MSHNIDGSELEARMARHVAQEQQLLIQQQAERIRELEERINELRCFVTSDDQRLDYVEVRVPRSLWGELQQQEGGGE